MAKLAVIGGGMAGMATALFAARHGHEVVVVDRDAGPRGDTADEFATWVRRGVAQAGFAHFFLARAIRAIREEAPDLLEDLARTGIQPADVDFGDGFEADQALLARRPVFESVLRRAVERECGIEFHVGSVTALIADGEMVRGVQIDDSSELLADLTVDAGGRRTASSRWMADAGLPTPAVEEESCDRHYYCRHYRLNDGEDYPSLEVPVAQPLPYGIVLVFVGDDRTFAVATELSAHDPLRARLQDPEVFDRYLRAIPMTRDWLERAHPTSDLFVMAGLSNRRRRLVVEGRPLVSGLVLVGDSCQYTNPALGQGVSLSLWMSQRVATNIEEFVAVPTDALVRHERWVDEYLGPFFERQLVVDRRITLQYSAGVAGSGFLPPSDPSTERSFAVMALRASDPLIDLLATRVSHLLTPPAAVDADPVAKERIDAFLASGPAWPTGEGVLPRSEFELVVG